MTLASEFSTSRKHLLHKNIIFLTKMDREKEYPDELPDQRIRIIMSVEIIGVHFLPNFDIRLKSNFVKYGLR